MKTIHRRVLTVLAGSALLFVGACAGIGSSAGQNYNTEDQEVRMQDAISHNFLTNQPPPVFPFSQIRENLKEIEKAQAEGVQTTSFFFNMGERDPIQTCPSIGAPIPTTASLTNPEQPTATTVSRSITAAGT